MNKKSISEIVVDALRVTYSRALLCIAFIVLASSFFAWSLLVRPIYNKLSATKEESRRVLALRNVQLFVSEAQQSVSNVSTLFRACEGAIYAISSDIHSFKKEDAAVAGPVPVLGEFLSGGAYARTVKTNIRHGGLVSYEYPGIYCPSPSCYERSNPELDFLSGYWQRFLALSKKLYAIGPEVQWVYFASASGEITMYPALPGVPGGYDPRSRHWYKDSLRTSDVVWFPPYFAAGGSDYVITVSKKIDNIPPLSDTVAGIDINLQSLMTNRLSFPYCEKCRLMIADENGSVIAERDMAKKGDWKNTPAPVKLEVVLKSVLKREGVHLLAKQLSGGSERAERIVDDNYIFSLPIGFLNWRLLGIIPVDYYGPDGLSIIKSLESILGNARRGLFLVLLAVSALVLLSIAAFFFISKSAIKNRLMPLLGQFVALSRSLKGGRISEDWQRGPIGTAEGLSSEYDDISTAILSYEKEVTVQSRLAAISETAGQVAHDIRSPLAALGAATKGLDIPSDQRTLIDCAIGRMQGIANDLLARYRNPDAAVETKIELCALGGIIEQVLAEKRLQHKDKPEVKIEFDDRAGGARAAVAPKELQRAISNLVNNAVEAFEKSGTVSVGLAADNGRVLISVKDNGKGIPPEILAKLGQKGGTHGKSDGTGLGLYHARTIAESWGGGLQFDSEPGKGTTVTLTLPAAAKPAAVLRAALLDDDPLVHMNWKLAAKAAGAELKSYKTAQELTSAAGTLPRDIPLFIDSDLGEGIKGEDIAKEFHNKGFTDITIATGHGVEKFAHLHWLKVTGKEPPWAAE